MADKTSSRHQVRPGGINKRQFLEIVALSMGGLALSPLQAKLALAQEGPSKVNVAIFHVTDVDMIAKGEGYFSQMASPNIEWVEVESGAEINAAMVSGSLDVGLEIGSSPTSAGISQGIPYKVILLTADQARAEELVVRTSASIKTAQDLRGKKVATPFGSTSHFRLLGFLKINNLTERDVTVLDLRGDALAAAWQRGDIDGAYIWDPFKSNAISSGGELFVTYKSLAEAGYVTAGFYVVHDSFVEKYPDVVKGFVLARAKAVELWRNKPDEAAAIVAKYVGISAEEAKKGLAEYDYISLEDRISPQWFGTSGNPGKFAEVLKRTADFLVEQKSIRSAPELEVFQQAINTSFLEQAAKEAKG